MILRLTMAYVLGHVRVVDERDSKDEMKLFIKDVLGITEQSLYWI